MSFLKPILYVSLAFTFPIYIWAQKAVPDPTFNFYLPVSNVDSLEHVMLKTPKNTLAYTDLLLKYEHSYLVMHDVHSKYRAELINQSKKEGNPSRKAMFNFLFGWRLISKEAENQIISLNKAVSHYEAVRDTAGMVSCYGLLLWLNYINQNNFELNRRAVIFMDKITALSEKSNDLGVKINYAFYKYVFFDSSKIKESFEESMQQLDLLVSQAEASPVFSPYLNLLFNLQGTLYAREEKFELAIESFKKLKIEENHDSFNYLVNLLNLGIDYFKIGKFDIAKVYFEKVLSKADLEKRDLLLAYQRAYNRLGQIEQQSDPVKAAQLFRNAYEVSLLQNQIENEKTYGDVQAIFEQDQAEKRFKTLSAEKLRIEQQNLQIKILLILAILSILCIAVLAFRFFTLSSRLKKITLSQDKLFSIIAHDLRSPAKNFQKYFELINYFIEKKEFNKLIEVSKLMEKTGLHLDSMLTNLFQWGVTQLGGSQIKMVEINSKDFFESILPIYRDISITKDIKLIEEIDYANIKTDSNILATIIRNLLDNALKYSENHTKVILQFKANPNDWKITIANQTDVFVKEQISKIDYLFNGTRNYNFGESGLGFGLIIAKQSADLIRLNTSFKFENSNIVTLAISKSTK